MTHAELLTAFGPTRRILSENHPYTPSIASTASSSSTSVFSTGDGPSSQSSAASSVRSASLNWDGDVQKQHPLTLRCRQPMAASAASLSLCATEAHTCQPFGPASNAVPPELRLHPRRSQTAAQADASAGGARRPPPPLVRQCDRKDNFVENLVDTTSQMIEVVWPLSVVPCGRDAVLGGKNLIGLRTFIQEVLKRSKTSYSTLQVALYYLVLIKPRIPKVDFTKEQLEDSHASRAMQCGRRMFLAALILASKYLQDRNYSARAWSKISGLKVSEINSNEIAFVTAVDWKLHIPEPLFQRWTDIVLKYSLSAPSSPALRPRSTSWRSIITRLTPALDTIEVDDVASAGSARERPSRPPMSPPATIPRSSPDRALPIDPTSASLLARPDTLEPPPRAAVDNFRFPPISPKITQLPTPQMTPQNRAFGTPAAGAAGLCAGRSAMNCAMKQAQHLAMLRCTVDTWPTAEMHPFARRFPAPVRRSSEERSTTSSIMSSPESMVSDAGSQSSQSSQSSRSSRSSSISSVASSAGALPPPARLAVQATRRCASMHAATGKTAVAACFPGGEIWNNINPFAGIAEESYLRGRADDSEATAASALHELAFTNAGQEPPEPSCRNRRRKRERPASIVDSQLQEQVQALLKCRDVVTCGQSEDSVATDPSPARSFLLERPSTLPITELAHPAAVGSGSQSGARKRLCCMEEANISSTICPPARGPGMWNAIL